jgi:hypothetical protein
MTASQTRIDRALPVDGLVPGPRTAPEEAGGLLVAEALGEIPAPAQREYVRDTIVLGYN